MTDEVRNSLGDQSIDQGLIGQKDRVFDQILAHDPIKVGDLQWLDRLAGLESREENQHHEFKV